MKYALYAHIYDVCDYIIGYACKCAEMVTAVYSGVIFSIILSVVTYLQSFGYPFHTITKTLEIIVFGMQYDDHCADLYVSSSAIQTGLNDIRVTH